MNPEEKYIDLYYLGDDLYYNKKYEEALLIFKKALQIKDTDECLNYIGCCYLMLGNLSNAKDAFCLLIKRCNWERPLFNMARVYMEEKCFDEAYKFLNMAKMINPLDSDLLFYYGVYYDRQENYTLAIDYYLKSLETEFEQDIVHYNLSVCYIKIKQYKKAIYHCKQILTIGKGYIDKASYCKSVALIKMKKYQEAYNELKIIKTTDSTLKEDINFSIDYCLKQMSR